MKSQGEIQEHEHDWIFSRVLKASNGHAHFCSTIGSFLRGCAAIGIPKRATSSAGGIYATDSRTVAAIGSAHCAVSGQPRSTGSGGVHIS